MVEFKGHSEPIFVVPIVFLGIASVAVCLRCFVRIRLVKAFGWDDALMLFAMAWNILFAICGITGALYGMGQTFEEIELVNPKHVQTAMFWWWLGQISYVFTVVFAKISIALALLRLTVARLHSALLWVVIGVTAVIGTLFWFMLTLQCQPVSYFWERTGNGTCLKVDYLIDIAYLYSVTATLCDFVLGLLPFLLVWNLQMNTKTKAALAGILSMGCVASAAVIVRIPFLHTYKDTEFLYATWQISVWSNVEAGLGITAGSLVTLRPLFRWFRGDSYGATRSRSKRTGGSFPLSSMEGNGTKGSRHDPNNGTKYWRPDLDPEDSHGVVTAVGTSRGSRNSSQEDLNPKHHTAFHGVNVQKTFFVSADDV